MAQPSDDPTGGAEGVTTSVSPLGFEETLHRLLTVIEQRGLHVFALIDHDGAAAEADLTLRPTRVVIFGSPAAGTPLMAATPLLALELPLRILVWEGRDGRTRLSHLTADALTEQFHVPSELTGPLGAPAALIDAALAIER